MPKNRKLRLKKSTIRSLLPQEMSEVVGGRVHTTISDNGTCYLTCGSCDTLCPGGGCNDPTIADTCGCTQPPCF